MFQITNLTRRNPPAGGPKNNWKKAKDGVLGKNYDLCLVFAGNALMKKLNSRYRKISRPAAVLSFSLSEKEAPLRQSSAGQGEIFINLSQKKYPASFLFIHALLHLKSFKHGAKMREQEEKLMLKYFHGPRHSNRP